MTGYGPYVILTRKTFAAQDDTLNIAIGAGGGKGDAPTSVNNNFGQAEVTGTQGEQGNVRIVSESDVYMQLSSYLPKWVKLNN